MLYNFTAPNSDVKPKKIKLSIKQEIDVPYVEPHLLQIKASKEEILRRIHTLMERKRNEININNISEFCSGDRNSEFICARVDTKLKKRKDAKGHLQGKHFCIEFKKRKFSHSS